MNKANSAPEGTSKSAFMPACPKEVAKRWLPGVRVQENVYVEMRDGVKLAVDIYFPEAGGRYPGLLSMAPYIKEIQQHPPPVVSLY